LCDIMRKQYKLTTSMIDTKKFQVVFFFIVFGLVAYLIFLIYKPFLSVLFFAGIFAVILHPITSWLLRFSRGKRNIAAAITLLLAAVFIVIPLYFFSLQIFNESSGLYQAIAQGGSGSVFEKIATAVNQSVNQVFPSFNFQLQMYVGNLLDFISRNIASVVTGTAFAMLQILLVMLSTFFFLKDAPFFMHGFRYLSPLDDKYDQKVLETLERTINSVFRGALTVAIIQGTILMFLFYVFRIPNPFLWGSLAMVLALIPGLGTALVFVPGILYIFLVHNNLAGIGLAIFSILCHGAVDNFIAPLLYGKGMSVHPIFIMFSVLGGIMFFGPLGFIFGPVVFSVFIALFGIYQEMMVKAGEYSG